jgi:microsomal dipeptidase-like Zn-dependent dipeptidase
MLPATPIPADGLMPPGLQPGAGIEGLKGPQDYPALLDALRRRGWREEDVSAVTSRNLLAFLHRALPPA